MPSSYKTENLGLNRFVGTDHPKMEDFNFDNQQIDTKFQEHIRSQLHLSEQDRQSLKSAKYITGSYTGNGEASRTIQIGASVSYGVVFAVGEALSYITGSSGINHIYLGMMSDKGCSKGVTLATDGFTVQQSTNNPPDGKKNMLNQQGKTYVYFAFPKNER